MARYPDIQVCVRSQNPFAWVAAVRAELRRAGVARAEIRRFSEEALGGLHPQEVQRVCRLWVRVEGSAGGGQELCTC